MRIPAMKLTSTAIVLLVCAMVLTMAKFQRIHNPPESDAAPAPAVRKKVNSESVRKPGYAEIADYRNTKSTAYFAHRSETQKNPETADDTMPAGIIDQGEPALRNITGLTTEERQMINDRLVAASSTPDKADDREMMREIHRLSSESLSSVSNESDDSFENPVPNP